MVALNHKKTIGKVDVLSHTTSEQVVVLNHKTICCIHSNIACTPFAAQPALLQHRLHTFGSIACTSSAASPAHLLQHSLHSCSIACTLSAASPAHLLQHCLHYTQSTLTRLIAVSLKKQPASLLRLSSHHCDDSSLVEADPTPSSRTTALTSKAPSTNCERSTTCCSAPHRCPESTTS